MRENHEGLHLTITFQIVKALTLTLSQRAREEEQLRTVCHLLSKAREEEARMVMTVACGSSESTER
jgi:hypothetical protein